VPPGNGTANTGGGAGGYGYNSGSLVGGTGGSGVVIFTLPVQAIASFSGGVTQTSAVVGANRVYTVTAAGPTDTVTIG
jgi:hypothetical protein